MRLAAPEEGLKVIQLECGRRPAQRRRPPALKNGNDGLRANSMSFERCPELPNPLNT